MAPTTALLLLGMALGSGPSVGDAQAQELRRYDVSEQTSLLWVVTHKSGLLSFLGHEHAIVPGEWSGDLCLDRPISGAAHGAITIRTASLVIDSDSARALAGLDEGPDGEERREIQRKMLDSAYLAADRHPEIRLELRARGPVEDGTVPVHGVLHARGATQEVDLPVEVERAEGGTVWLTGSTQVLQTTLGMEPESVAGVVNVSDEVDLHFRLVAEAGSEPCERAGEASEEETEETRRRK